MGENLTRKIIRGHLVAGRMVAGEEVGLAVDQTLVQDATGTLVWQTFHTFGVSRVRPRVAVTYVDHNILQTGYENADDHLFLQSLCARYGAVFSRPGNGISHFAHLERFDRPGELLIGSDSHTCTAGATGMLAIGTGGIEVAAAMAGEPFYVKMPKVVRVNLVGRLRPWVAAKDVILELLRRLSVKGGLGRVFEYVGPGIAEFTVYQRATICNMTQELGATSGLFPSDEQTGRFLRAQGREGDWQPLAPDPDAAYDEELTIDLGALEPLIARPRSPDNVVPVREVAGTPVVQVAVGSSVNSGYADLMLVARVLKGRHVHPNVSMTMSPGSRQILLNIAKTDAFVNVTLAGVRALEVACGPCIGMGAAPPSHGHSVRTFNRNFRGRSGTADDSVWLCSPEVAVAAALTGAIADPRELGEPPAIEEPERYELYTRGFIEPPADGRGVDIYIGPNIVAPPEVPSLPERFTGRVLLRLGDNVSTDEIIPAGNDVLPLRSNIPAISEHTFRYVDPTFPRRAREAGGGLIVAGENYGQGSSREHAAATLMYLGVRAVLARSYARIHESNLVNFGIPPFRFENPADYERVGQGDELDLVDLRSGLEAGRPVVARNRTRAGEYRLGHALSRRQLAILLAGGLTRQLRAKWADHSAPR
ncbi:MAG TPA: aconitate hydratase [Methylomirabilota bacterium]|jgi:aconitate hydratase|nr:aconitate hydratase [Methylomirabilota bacterium]